MKLRAWFTVFLTCGMTLGGILAPRSADADQAEQVLGGIYFGVGIGWADISIPGRSLTMEGIDFSNITANEDNAGYRVDAGYWINKHVGFEVGAYMLGTVRATFVTTTPRPRPGRGRRRSRSTAIPSA